jgi:hypothetical protein
LRIFFADQLIATMYRSTPLRSTFDSNNAYKFWL